MQLQLTRVDNARMYSLLVGYLVDRAVIVTTPAMILTNPAYQVSEGDLFVCRAFAGRRALAFQTEVLRVAQLPFPHLHLRYPQRIEAVVIRNATRVPTQRPVSLLKRGPDGETTGNATLLDLSLTGAGVMGMAGFATASESIELVIPGLNGQPNLQLKAAVRQARAMESAGDAQQAHFGLEFLELTPEHTRELQELIQQHLLNEV